MVQEPPFARVGGEVVVRDLTHPTTLAVSVSIDMHLPLAELETRLRELARGIRVHAGASPFR